MGFLIASPAFAHLLLSVVAVFHSTHKNYIANNKITIMVEVTAAASKRQTFFSCCAGSLQLFIFFPCDCSAIVLLHFDPAWNPTGKFTLKELLLSLICKN